MSRRILVIGAVAALAIGAALWARERTAHAAVHYETAAVTHGGVAGIVFGVATAKIVSAIAGWPTVVSVLSVAGGFLFSAAVGIFFGYYPARKGSQLDPIEALRYE